MMVAEKGLGTGEQAKEAGRTRCNDSTEDRYRRRLWWWRRGPVAMVGSDHRLQAIADESRVPDGDMVGRAKARRHRRRKAGAESEMQDKNEEKRRQPRDSRLRRRKRTLQKGD